jgi:hypothetical protein
MFSTHALHVALLALLNLATAFVFNAPSARAQTQVCHAAVGNAVGHPNPLMGAVCEPHSEMNNILILDHVNLNHQKGRHDLVRAFYFDVLGCAADPRKAENLESGRKTLWANIGINQFHTPEDPEGAQVVPGKILLTYSDLGPLRQRLAAPPAVLKDSKFSWREDGDAIEVTCPWVSSTCILHCLTTSQLTCQLGHHRRTCTCLTGLHQKSSV